MERFKDIKVAIVHDYLNQYGGAERCLEIFHRLFPRAPVFTLLYDKDALPQYRDWDIRTSFIQGIPFAGRSYRNFMWLFPLAMRRLDLKGFDLILSSTHAWGKGIRTGQGSCHICFCLTPIRYFWDLYDEYRRNYHFSPLMRLSLPLFVNSIRRWDLKMSRQVDYFIAISKVVSGRIRRFYARESSVIYPSIDTSFFAPSNTGGDGGYYLSVCRLKEYKRVDLIVEAFSRLKLPLKVAGSGEMAGRLKRNAGPNIEFVGPVYGSGLRDLYQGCRALVFAANEDFGLVPLEAQACGRPVIAFAGGGALETVIEGVTGTFFREQDARSLIEAVTRFQRMRFDAAAIRRNAVRFDNARFETEFLDFVYTRYEEFNRAKA